MKSKRLVTCQIILFGLSAFACGLRAQESAVASPGPPKYLNMTHQELKSGRTGAYGEMASSIARSYNRENIPVFWVELGSITGPPEALYINFFDSAEEMAKSAEASNAAMAAHPELAQMKDRLLQENTANEMTVLAVRREDMGYRANAIDFSKMRALRLTTVFAHPGYERAFMETEWALSEASQKVHAQAAWAVYEVIGGLPEPAFVIVTPMQSLQEIEDIFQTSESLKKTEGGVVQQRLQELARVAFGTSDTRIFAVGAKMSHISTKFAAGDPEFWAPAMLAGPPNTPRSERGTPRSTGSPSGKP